MYRHPICSRHAAVIFHHQNYLLNFVTMAMYRVITQIHMDKTAINIFRIFEDMILPSLVLPSLERRETLNHSNMFTLYFERVANLVLKFLQY